MTPEEVVRETLEADQDYWANRGRPGTNADALAALDALIAERDEARRENERLRDLARTLLNEWDNEDGDVERDYLDSLREMVGKPRVTLSRREQSLEARLNEARKALEPFIWTTTPIDADETYRVAVRGSDILRGRRALASISDTEGALEMEPQGEDSLYGPPPNYANPAGDTEGGDK